MKKMAIYILFTIGALCVLGCCIALISILTNPIDGRLFNQQKFISKNIPLENGKYTLIVNTNDVYGIIDDKNLLISNRDSLTIGTDFTKVFSSKNHHSLMLFEGSALIITKSVLLDDNMNLGTLKAHLRPITKIAIKGHKEQIKLAQDSIKNNTIYYLQKPNFKPYNHSFRITLPTIILKAAHLNDEKKIISFSNRLEKEIQHRINQQFPKGNFEIDDIGGGYRGGYPKKNAFLVNSEGKTVRDSDGNYVTDEGVYFYFNKHINIICEPDYYYTHSANDFASFFDDLSSVKDAEIQAFMNQKASSVDTQYYPPPYFIKYIKTYQISDLKEVEYNLTYLEENKAIQKQ